LESLAENNILFNNIIENVENAIVKNKKENTKSFSIKILNNCRKTKI